MKIAFAGVLFLLGCWSAANAAEVDILIADFEGSDYGAWKVEGTAFGNGPVHGTLPNQQEVTGYIGKGLVNSYNGGDDALGKLTSPDFKIERKYITFLIGGGGFAGLTCMNLVAGGKIIRTASGPNTQPGGSETLAPGMWDVSDLLGTTAHLEIVDAAKGGWGHINVDQIVQSDRRETMLRKEGVRDLVAAQHFLNFPVRSGAPKQKVKVSIGARVERAFEIELADGDPQWWAPLDISAWTGKTLSITAEKLPEGSKALSLIEQSDTLKEGENIYREALRPQFHFSAKRGWLNDPNGLVFFKGEYHLFFQHNPYGWNWGNMHWGHAVSHDLVHWEELGEALYPDELGTMFSGSSVVDNANSCGLGQDGKPAQVLFYTADGNPTTQCMASSVDGRTYTKFSGNPIVKQITGGNRDPKVFWYEPAQKWIMALYVGLDDPVEKDKNGKPVHSDTIHFMSSFNLKEWKFTGQIGGFYECPDIFELPLDGNAANKKWVLSAANSQYMLGTFDGTTFTPQTNKLRGQAGRGFYAAQTYNNEPAGRRVQIGWMQAPSPGMPFNQCMSLPLQLSLRTTNEGPRLNWQPVAELEALRGKTFAIDSRSLKPGDANPLAAINAELLELRIDFEPGSASEINFKLRGIPVTYDVKKQDISVNGTHAAAPLRDGHQRLSIYLDRTTIEVFASDGFTYVPCPAIPKAENLSIEVAAQGGEAKIEALNVYELRSAWDAGKAGETRNGADILKSAMTVWNMSGLKDSQGRNELKPNGAVKVGIALEDREKKKVHLSDGIAAEFDGGYLDAGQGTDNGLNLKGSALSICVRLRCPTGVWDAPIFSKHDGHDKLVYNLYSSPTAIGFELGTQRTPGMTNVQIPVALIGAREWHQIIARYDGAKLQIFADGVWIDEGFPMGPLREGNMAPCLIGAESIGGTIKAGFKGLIDHVAIWNRALSDAEIEMLSGGAERVAALREKYLGELPSLQYYKPRDPFNIGDTLPFFHDGVFRFYYLLDRGHHTSKNRLGAHQWAQASSTDLIHWEDQPLAIPITQENEGSICTGSVFFDAGTYYGFYATRGTTGGERLSLAKSTDGIHFDKTEPNPFLSPGPKYTGGFRDPHVFLDTRTGLFHLIVSTTLKEDRRACLAQYVSKDLKSWDESEPLLVEEQKEVPECPDYFEWNGWYYLIFSYGQVARYRMSKEPLGPWLRPEMEFIDGKAARVLKTAAFKNNRRIGTASIWPNGYAGWAVFRELIQHPDGTLGSSFVPEMIPKSGESVALQFKALNVGASGDGRALRLNAPEGKASAELSPVPANCRVRMRIDGKAASIALKFRAGAAEGPGIELDILPGEKKVLMPGGAQLTGVEGLDQPFALDIILKDRILDVCVNGQRTLVNWVEEARGERLILSVEKGAIVCDKIDVAPLTEAPEK